MQLIVLPINSCWCQQEYDNYAEVDIKDIEFDCTDSDLLQGEAYATWSSYKSIWVFNKAIISICLGFMRNNKLLTQM